MAEKYLSVYGPSTAAELAHWAGWTITRGKEVLSELGEEGKITKINISNTLRFMLSGTEFPPKEKYPYVRLLHNDDEIHLAWSGRCKELFKFHLT